MVVRTGLNTTMGAMVRQLIAPVDVKKEKDPFEPVSVPGLLYWDSCSGHLILCWNYDQLQSCLRPQLPDLL